MTARKLFILLVTVAALLVLYIIYSSFNNAHVLVIGKGTGRTADTNVSDYNGTMGKIGVTRIGTVVKAVYTDLDENKNVKREFGFEKLLHESGNEWTLQKPYMNIVEKDFVCGITADTGKVQVEIAGGKPAPKDAQLSGNVVIHILPDKGARMSESFVYMDDISFISEKSLFTTAGPVRFVSADAEMAGKGLEVIYNGSKDRLELMQLVNLEYIRLKTFKESVFAKRDGGAKGTAGDKGDGQTNVAAGTSGGQQNGDQQNGDQYYRCTLSKNVVINYGTQAVLADEVAISNLFWPKNKEGGGKKDVAATTSTAPSGDVNGTSIAGNSAEEIIPVVITCENGIIVRPMEETASSANVSDVPQRMLELSGTPVVIKAGTIIGADAEADGVSGNRVLAECGWLKYNLDLGVLDMFTRGQQKYVSLNLEQDGAKLETTNSLTWSIKDRKAVVRGPGTLYLAAKKQDADKAQMNFGGTMNVNFADEPRQDSFKQSINIKSVSLAGGFTAAMQNDKSHLAADSATLLFGKGNSMSEADLDGNVRLNSNMGSLQTQKAKVLFAKGNTVSEADLNGDVNFDSGTGSLRSQNAKVFFTKDDKGNVYASMVQSFGNVEVFPTKTKGQKTQGVFRAQRIDYDIPRGYALADGPVELTVKADGGAAVDANATPLSITAKRKAEYFLKSNEVVFEGDVQGKMVKDSNEYNEFNGDKLVAKLGQNKNEPNAAKKSGIEHLAITGDVVKFESYQKQQDNVIGGIKLKCRQVDYDGITNAVSASGGSDCFVVIDNSKAPEPEKGGGSFNLKGPCYAHLWDFDNLQWDMKDNRIIADGVPAGMHIAYLPIAKGKYGQKVQIDTGHTQIDFIQTPVGRKVVSAIKATGGIHYLEENSYEFFGNELLYDSGKSLISIAGDSAKPCMVNGVIVDSIAYNLSNGNVQTQGLHGGSIPIPTKKAK